MRIDELLLQAREAEDLFWFVRALTVVERTNATVTLHFDLTPGLFVQVFLSERSGRFSLALIGPAGRLYGQDREHGRWHRHPFARPDEHEPIPEGISPRPIHQFLSEVEQILTGNDLIQAGLAASSQPEHARVGALEVGRPRAPAAAARSAPMPAAEAA